MTDTETLADWLLVQIAEDERRARAAGNVKFWKDDIGRSWIESPHGRVDLDEGSMPLTVAMLMNHVVMHLPARVLAECESKRLIVEEHTPKPPLWEVDYCPRCRSDEEIDVGSYDQVHMVPDSVEFPCSTLRALAVPYADRPGFREEWRP